MEEKKTTSLHTAHSLYSHNVALCGVFCALSLLMILGVGYLPMTTYVAPVLAGICIAPVSLEAGPKWGWLLYVATALLASFLVPDKELAALFVLFFGYYPLLKAPLDRLRRPLLRTVLKMLIFNIAVAFTYWLLLVLFPLPALVGEFGDFSRPMLAVLIVLANITFLLYDLSLGRLKSVYLKKMRPRITGFFH